MEVTESDEEDRKYLAKLREELDTFVVQYWGMMGWRPALVGCTVDSLMLQKSGVRKPAEG